MAKFKIDAVKTASDIHKGDFSSLRGKSFLICDSMKKNNGRGKPVKNLNREEKMTLSKLAKIVSDGFKRVDTRIDNLEKDINARLDNIEKRLDYNGLQIERIEKRLDYNNLKQLPKSNK